jgi:hypothetical protein
MICCSVHRIDVNWHMEIMFVWSLEARAKMSRTERAALMSWAAGTRKATRSSGYKEFLCRIARECSEVRRPVVSASWNMSLSASMASTNNNGDTGSPWWRPLTRQMRQPGCPLRRMRVLVLDSKAEIQLTQCRENPMNRSISSKNGQFTMSHALVISTLSKIQARG